MDKWLKLDAQLSARLHVAEKPGLLRRLAIFFGHSGDSWFWGLGLALVMWLGSADWRSRALALFVGIVLTAIVVMAIKFSVRRARPAGEWGRIYRKADPHSFPSGHAARAAMLAALGLALGPAWFGALLVVWAPLVGLARVATGLHFVSDVVVGWLLGILMGWVTLQVLGLDAVAAWLPF
ncbi:MAG: phosphatase PAP2 family protein [Anaerolineales bacterium]|nr:phosphatase PAP2 family protein [Anaerolineales bacterium]